MAANDVYTADGRGRIENEAGNPHGEHVAGTAAPLFPR